MQAAVVHAWDDPPVLARRDIVLRDGSRLELHPIDAADAAALLRFHGTLSTETTYLRFFSVHPELSRDELWRFTHVDHRDREALVATGEGGGEIVAVARFDRIDESDAEVAFVVVDSWQGRGVGGALFGALAERARQLGISRFVADTLPHNHRMLAVFRHAGYPVSTRFVDGVIHVVIDLDHPE